MYFSRIRIRPGINELSELADMLRYDQYAVHRMLWRLFPNQEARTFLYREEIAREQLGPSPSVRGEPVYYLVSQVEPLKVENSLFEVESKTYQPTLQKGDVLSFSLRANPVVQVKVARGEDEQIKHAKQRKDKGLKEKITKKRVHHDVVMHEQRRFLQALINECSLQQSIPANPSKAVLKQLLLNQGGAVLEKRLTELLCTNPLYAERLTQISVLSDKLEWAIKAQIDQALQNWLVEQGEGHGFALVTDQSGLFTVQNSAYAWHSLPQKTDKKGEKAGFSSVDFTGELQITDPEKFREILFNGLGRAKAFGCGLLMVRRVVPCS
ncbi:type I-E CRISPR-associated protein Cas6/Cse3/CasE [Methylomonas rosea]|uniref:Type I-E CRISPR-associated protein Cas6/Cse3/CasE n=1 Tax=Methylomonas rosea TaxID=2952227 RepID=A0ABT1TX71_9GAMM|nr:type I-E CRISPR-associated protein Cas6/Cse3/CasE [Methylomonas sp. WSC-7]MCQ8119042.1 type I-E CRISPR-associated protein Cas6/Cse3/CasE [Methylomonas sp. WSC-7]